MQPYFEKPFEKIHNSMIEELRKRNYSERDILEISTTFFFAFQMSLKDEGELTPENYQSYVDKFLRSLDDKLSVTSPLLLKNKSI